MLGREIVLGVCCEDEAWLTLSLGEKEGASRSPDRLICTTFLLVGEGWLWKVVTVVSAGGVFGVPLA